MHTDEYCRPKASVLTLVRGRQAHLNALITGLTKQTEPDFELVIASMQPEAPILPANLPFTVTIVPVSGHKLPLAAARNAAAFHARSDRLIFLDVDCIPSPALVASYTCQLDAADRCLMGEIRYLPGTFSGEEIEKQTFWILYEQAIPHPARPVAPTHGWVDEPQARSLWGLSFCLRRHHFQMVGGMDEAFKGYGGEETDFAERLAASGLGLAWCANAHALHQYHPVHSPPFDKFGEIVDNAELFYSKWGSWCMEYWLDQFASHGLIRWTPEGANIEIKRVPANSEIRQCRQGPEVAFA